MWCSGIDGEIIRVLLNHDGAAPYSMSHQDGDIRPDQTRHGMEKGSPGRRLCRPEARQRGLDSKGAAGSRTGSSPLLFASRCFVLFVLLSSRAGRPQAPEAGAEVEAVPGGLLARPSKIDLQPRRMLGSAGAVLDKGGRQGVGATDQTCLYPMRRLGTRGNGWCR